MARRAYQPDDRSWLTVDYSTGGQYGVAEKQPGQRVRRVGNQYAQGGWNWNAVKRKTTRQYRAGIGFIEIERRYRDVRGRKEMCGRGGRAPAQAADVLERRR